MAYESCANVASLILLAEAGSDEVETNQIELTSDAAKDHNIHASGSALAPNAKQRQLGWPCPYPV